VPYFRDIRGFQQSHSSVFERAFQPNEEVPLTGIYQCQVCGFESVMLVGETFPAERACSNHGTNWNGAQGKVCWRLSAAPISTNG
jgi:hypothetical protein